MGRKAKQFIEKVSSENYKAYKSHWTLRHVWVLEITFQDCKSAWTFTWLWIWNKKETRTPKCQDC